MFLSSSQYFAFFSLKTLCKSKKGQIRDQQLTMNPNMCVKTKNETCGNFELLAPYLSTECYSRHETFTLYSIRMLIEEQKAIEVSTSCSLLRNDRIYFSYKQREKEKKSVTIYSAQESGQSLSIFHLTTNASLCKVNKRR